MAAAQAGRDIIYFTFMDTKQQESLQTFVDQLKQSEITVGKLSNETPFPSFSTPASCF